MKIAHLLIATLGLALILLLNLWKPIWLAPPWFQYTPFVYALLELAWLLIVVHALSRLASRLLLVVLVVCLLLAQCCLGMVFVQKPLVELIDLGVWGGTLGMNRLSCGYESPSPQQTLYRCELCLGSSDLPQETIYAYEFAVLDSAPIMLLRESSTRYQRGSGYGMCERR